MAVTKEDAKRAIVSYLNSAVQTDAWQIHDLMWGTIREKTGVSETTFAKAIEELKQEGTISGAEVHAGVYYPNDEAGKQVAKNLAARKMLAASPILLMALGPIIVAMASIWIPDDGFEDPFTIGALLAAVAGAAIGAILYVYGSRYLRLLHTSAERVRYVTKVSLASIGSAIVLAILYWIVALSLDLRGDLGVVITIVLATFGIGATLLFTRST